MRELVRTCRYVITTHGHEEMSADGLTIFDVEHCIHTGRILERQRDRGTGGWKYLIAGLTLSGETAVTVARVGPTGKLVVITVYLE